MKIEEIRNLSDKELFQAYKTALKERFDLRISRGLKQPIKSNHQFGELKRKVARILTVLNERRKKNS